MKRFLLSVFFFEVGLVLIVAPWTVYWERNYFLANAELVSAALSNEFVRGAVSGLGVMNIYVAVEDIGRQLWARRSVEVSGRLFDSTRD